MLVQTYCFSHSARAAKEDGFLVCWMHCHGCLANNLEMADKFGVGWVRYVVFHTVFCFLFPYQKLFFSFYEFFMSMKFINTVLLCMTKKTECVQLVILQLSSLYFFLSKKFFEPLFYHPILLQINHLAFLYVPSLPINQIWLQLK